MSIKYSVIIPVYNSEATVRRCLDSLVGQGYADCELIVINDGSNDKSGEICSEYAAKYPQLRYIEKPNGGVSSARNAGLDAASGEYILFVDSDDYVADTFFSALDNATANAPDYIQFFRKKGDKATVQSYSGEAAVDWLCGEVCNQHLNSPGAKAFRRDIIEKNSLRFPPELSIGEDKVFVIRYILEASSFLDCGEVLYHVVADNKNSLSRRRRENLCDSILLEHDAMFGAVEAAALSDAGRQKFMAAVSYSFFRSAYTVIRELRKFDYGRAERLKRTKEVCRRYAERNGFYRRTLKHRLIAVPVKNGWAGLIDLMIGLLCKRYS